MTKVRKYSLWAMPTETVYDNLFRVISELSGERPSYSFQPHVTLLGGLLGTAEEMSSGASHLATLIQPYSIRLNKVDYLNEFYRCLFIKVEPTKAVRDAHLNARAVFDQLQEPEYMPHLSLMYGDLPPAAKEQIIGRIGRVFDLQFEVKTIHLYSTKGEPKDWYRVQEFALNEGGPS